MWKNGLSVHGGFPPHYGRPHNVFSNKTLVLLGGKSTGYNTWKIEKIWINPKKEHINAELGVKNGMSIRGGSITHYGVLHKIFWGKLLGTL